MLKYFRYFLTPAGEMVLLRSNPSLGEGGFKTVSEAFVIDLKNIYDGLHSVAFAQPKNKNNQALREYNEEINIIKKIQKDLSKKGPDHTVGIAKSYMAPDDNGVEIIFQKKYSDGTLIPKKHLNFNDNKAFERARMISQGLSNLHSIGYVHSDIKPANIFVSKNTSEAVLGDFGLSFLNDYEPPKGGTFAYYAPERIITNATDNIHTKKSKNNFYKEDVYTLGLTFLLSPQFCEYSINQCIDEYFPSVVCSGSREEKCLEKANQKIRNLLKQKALQYENNPQLKEFTYLLMSCLEFDPNKRPTAQKLLKRISAIQGDPLQDTLKKNSNFLMSISEKILKKHNEKN